MKASDIISAKGSGVNTILPHSTIREALRSMIENNVGSLVVVDSELCPTGIITERDIIKLAYREEGKDWQSLAVSGVMTDNIIIGFPDDEVEYIMTLMTKNRFRHMPILSERKLAGLISIGDVVKSQLKDIKTENRYLSDYIAGKYPA